MSTLTADELLAGAAVTHRVRVPAGLLGRDAHEEQAEEQDVVLRPLVLADVAKLNRAAGSDGELASALMVQQAMVDPPLNIEQVHRLSAGLIEFLLGEVNRISGLAMDADELDSAVHAPLARACFVLAREFGWTPDRCADLTVGQILLYLEMLGRGERPG